MEFVSSNLAYLSQVFRNWHLKKVVCLRLECQELKHEITRSNLFWTNSQLIDFENARAITNEVLR